MADGSSAQIIVVGAGVSGLTSALCLAEAGWSVRVWTAASPQQTTSVVAGAVWIPPRPVERAVETLGWTEFSLGVFRELATDPDTGVRLAPALSVGELSASEAMSSAARLIPQLRPAEPAELPDGYEVGFRATVPMIDMPHYLEYLTRRLAAAGCEIEEHPVRSLAEAADEAPNRSYAMPRWSRRSPAYGPADPLCDWKSRRSGRRAASTTTATVAMGSPCPGDAPATWCAWSALLADRRKGRLDRRVSRQQPAQPARGNGSGHHGLVGDQP